MQRRTDEWATFSPDREVLAVVRSVPTAGRLLDVTALLADDRVGVTFTVTPGSASEAGVRPMLRAAGIDPVPWEKAVAESDSFDLALAASTKGGLHRLDAPVVLMPHGAGHNRRVGGRPGSLASASGLDPAELLHEGRLIADRFVLSHSEQADRLHESCPEAKGRSVVAGDPAFDRMVAALGRRERYREALHLRGRRLVVVSSTWNRDSLLGSQHEVVQALLAELPQDEYRVAVVAHPNVWSHHSRAQLELWFHEEIEAGLVLVPPAEGWRAALIAADAVLGDVGSVTYYAASLGRPVLLAAFATADLDPRSPLLEFGSALPKLEPGRIAEQVDRVARMPVAPVADLLIEHQNESATRLRALLYTLLELTEPPLAAHYRPLPDLPEHPEDVTAWRVAFDPPEDLCHDGQGAAARLRRFPAGAPAPRTHSAPVRPLVVDAEDAVMPRWGSADAWSYRRRSTEEDASAWLKERVSTYPKTLLAVASLDERSALLMHRSGLAMRVHDESGAQDRLDASVVAAAAIGWARQCLPWRRWHTTVRVRLGDRTLLLRASPPRRNSVSWEVEVGSDQGSSVQVARTAQVARNVRATRTVHPLPGTSASSAAIFRTSPSRW